MLVDTLTLADGGYMCLFPRRIKQGITVPCGYCPECRQKMTREWTARICNELKYHNKSCFITLTYNDEHLPLGGELYKRDYQLFLKRLRKKVGKVRYFMSGEYGGKNKRPHYHFIIFGWCPDDLFYFYSKDGQDLYRSPTIEKLWTLGYSVIGCEINPSTIKYVAKYLQKPFLSEGKLLKPFVSMSLHPGLGFKSIKPELLESDKLYYNGFYVSLPRYFLKILSKDFPLEVQNLKLRRLENLINSINPIDYRKYLYNYDNWQKIMSKKTLDNWLYKVYT